MLVRLGVRYEDTDVAAPALAPAYVGINWVGGNELTAIQAPDLTFTDLEGDYDAVLPNIDFRLDVTDNIVLRASYSETLTRPNYADIQGGQTISSLVRIDGGDGNRGNPALLPFESDNIDLSQWYYGNGSYVAVGYFDKDVENFISTSSVVENTSGCLTQASVPSLMKRARQVLLIREICMHGRRIARMQKALMQRTV